MKRLRVFLLVLAGVAMVVCGLAAHYYYKGFYGSNTRDAHIAAGHRVDALEESRIAVKAAELKKFLGRSGSRYNAGLAFLVDMRLPSGKNRFFVYDLSHDSIVLAGLVAHGSGETNFSILPVFSNASGSYCSALGRYRVGHPYNGQFGRAYLLDGLDTSNDQALDRHIVLHSYSCVPDGETDPYPICNSRGCPMISPSFLKSLQPLIDRSPRSIVLWIFT